jgi:galactose oxidase
VTHAFDSDQRYVGLEFFASGHTLVAKAPPNHQIAPPGYYLLFIVDSEARPSIGRFVRLL